MGQLGVPGREELPRDCLKKTKAIGDLQEEEIGSHTDGLGAIRRRPPMAVTAWPWAGGAIGAVVPRLPPRGSWRAQRD